MAMDSIATVNSKNKSKEKNDMRLAMRGSVILLASIVVVISVLIGTAVNWDNASVIQSELSETDNRVDLPVTDTSDMGVIDLSQIESEELKVILGSRTWRFSNLELQRDGDYGLECDFSSDGLTAGSEVTEYLLVDVETGKEIVDSLDTIFTQDWSECADRGSTVSPFKVFTNGESFIAIGYTLGNDSEAAVTVFASK